jgi:hypothetical protein
MRKLGGPPHLVAVGHERPKALMPAKGRTNRIFATKKLAAKTLTVKPDYFKPVGHAIYRGLASYSEGKKCLHM